MNTMINEYNKLNDTQKAYAEKVLPDFDTWYQRELNHWTNPQKDSRIAMIRTITAFTAWFEAIGNDTYGLC